MSELITLIYGSFAAKPFSEADLVALLAKAREKNRRLQVTGMLLYNEGNFLQVLEGEIQNVDAVFEAISKDPRHVSVQVLLKRPIRMRSFQDWEMAFVNLKTVDASQIPGYSSYLNEPLHLERFKDASYAYTFLEVFKQAIR